MYTSILLAIDLEHESSWQKALPTAVELCRSFSAKLSVITVVPDFGMSVVAQQFPTGFEKKAVAATEKRLNDLLTQELTGGVDASSLVAVGSVYREVLAAADRISADLIVLAAHRPELKDYLLGPNAARVVRHFNGSVMVVRS
jgi:nucleotide-binding universal stress UspA family protein